MGLGLGALVDRSGGGVDGVPYVQFVAPGRARGDRDADRRRRVDVAGHGRGEVAAAVPRHARRRRSGRSTSCSGTPPTSWSGSRSPVGLHARRDAPRRDPVAARRRRGARRDPLRAAARAGDHGVLRRQENDGNFACCSGSGSSRCSCSPARSSLSTACPAGSSRRVADAAVARHDLRPAAHLGVPDWPAIAMHCAYLLAWVVGGLSWPSAPTGRGWSRDGADLGGARRPCASRSRPAPGWRACSSSATPVYRSFWPTIVSGFFEPVFYLFSLGVGLGHGRRRRRRGDGHSCLRRVRRAGAARRVRDERAMFDTTCNVFFKLKYAQLYDSVLATPLGPRDVAVGEITWALLRGAIYAAASWSSCSRTSSRRGGRCSRCRPRCSSASPSPGWGWRRRRTCAAGRTSTRPARRAADVPVLGDVLPAVDLPGGPCGGWSRSRRSTRAVALGRELGAGRRSARRAARPRRRTRSSSSDCIGDGWLAARGPPWSAPRCLPRADRLRDARPEVGATATSETAATPAPAARSLGLTGPPAPPVRSRRRTGVRDSVVHSSGPAPSSTGPVATLGLSVGASNVIGDDQSPSCRIAGDDSSDHSIRTAFRERPFQR